MTKSDGSQLALKRSSLQYSITCVSNQNNSFFDYELSRVQTSDLLATFQVYRIKRIDIELVPLYDPSTDVSGKSTDYLVYMACDTTGATTLVSPQVITAFDNYKMQSIVGGEKFKYSFYPKALNELGQPLGVNDGVGSYDTNPWITLTSDGIQVPHARLLWSIQSPSVSNAILLYTLTYHFDVKRIK